jgi:hypothetical protein
MTKVFCDCCGKEVVGGTTSAIQFNVEVKSNPVHVGIELDTDSDICSRCVRVKIIERFQDEIATQDKANKVHVTPPPQFAIPVSDRMAIFSKAVEEAAEEAFKAQSTLTKEQFVEALMQAIKCGDFVRYVRAGDHAQQVVYLPFQREQELEGNVEQLEQWLYTAHIQDGWTDEMKEWVESYKRRMNQ